jgi:hypothetical protein
VKEIIVLGSGPSILQLTSDEINYINSCEVKIAINKFMAFYEKSFIIPNNIYYVDDYEPSVVLMLDYIFNKCIENNLKKLNFIINKSHQEKLNLEQFKDNHYTFEFITHQDWLNQDQIWSNNLEDPLFHYRGSLTTVLNYISIKYPNRDIKLVGVDLYSDQYFFQEQLEGLDFDYRDWTSDIVKKEKLHFSAVNHQNTTIYDKFDFILDNLLKSNNNIYICSSKSLLLHNTKIQYKKLLDH